MKKIIASIFILTSIVSFSKNGIPAINELSEEELLLIQQGILEEEYQKEIQEKEHEKTIELKKEEVLTGESLYFKNSDQIKIKIGQYKNEFKRISEKTEDTEKENKNNTAEDKETKENTDTGIAKTKEN